MIHMTKVMVQLRKEKPREEKKEEAWNAGTWHSESEILQHSLLTSDMFNIIAPPANIDVNRHREIDKMFYTITHVERFCYPSLKKKLDADRDFNKGWNALAKFLDFNDTYAIEHVRASLHEVGGVVFCEMFGDLVMNKAIPRLREIGSNEGKPREEKKEEWREIAEKKRAACGIDWHDCTNGLGDLLFTEKGRAIRAACINASINTFDILGLTFGKGDYFDMRSADKEYSFLATGLVEIKDYSWGILCSYNLNTDQVIVKEE